MDMSIIIALFGIGILALTLQIAITTKKEWFAFLSFAAVFTIFLLLIVIFPGFGGIISEVFELILKLILKLIKLILKLIPWLIGGVVALGILMIILLALTWIVHDIRHPSSVAYWLMTDGKIDEAERLLNKAMTQKYKYSKEEISNIQLSLRNIRMIKEGRTKPETAETPIKLLPAQSIKVKGLLPVGPTLS